MLGEGKKKLQYQNVLYRKRIVVRFGVFWLFFNNTIAPHHSVLKKTRHNGPVLLQKTKAEDL